MVDLTSSQYDLPPDAILDIYDSPPVGLDETRLTTEQLKEVKDLYKEFKHSFAGPKGYPGTATKMQAKILMKPGVTPIHQAERPVNPMMRPIIAKEIERLHSSGVIRKVTELSPQAWTSPIVIVPKKQTHPDAPPGWRVCLDLRIVNSNCLKINYRSPLYSDYYHLVYKKKIMYTSCLDISKAYFSVMIDKSYRCITSFYSQGQLYEMNRLSMGLSCSAYFFVKYMDSVLRPELTDNISLYIDDALIISDSYESHLEHMRMFLEDIKEAGLKLNGEKSHTFASEVEYLGFIIGCEGIKPQPKKVECLQNYKAPRTIKQLRAFCGFSSYLRKFIPQFSQRLSPLLRSLKGTKSLKSTGRKLIDWSPECQRAFEDVRKSLTTDAMLIHPQSHKPYLVFVDASITGYGSVICQSDSQNHIRPLQYTSRTFNDSQKKWHSVKRELYGISATFRANELVLSNTPIVLFSDCLPALQMCAKQTVMNSYALMVLYLQGFQIEYCYLRGRNHIMADFLSRMSCPPQRLHEGEAAYLLKQSKALEALYKAYDGKQHDKSTQIIMLDEDIDTTPELPHITSSTFKLPDRDIALDKQINAMEETDDTVPSNPPDIVVTPSFDQVIKNTSYKPFTSGRSLTEQPIDTTINGITEEVLDTSLEEEDTRSHIINLPQESGPQSDKLYVYRIAHSSDPYNNMIREGTDHFFNGDTAYPDLGPDMSALFAEEYEESPCHTPAEPDTMETHKDINTRYSLTSAIQNASKTLTETGETPQGITQKAMTETPITELPRSPSPTGTAAGTSSDCLSMNTIEMCTPVDPSGTQSAVLHQACYTDMSHYLTTGNHQAVSSSLPTVYEILIPEKQQSKIALTELPIPITKPLQFTSISPQDFAKLQKADTHLFPIIDYILYDNLPTNKSLAANIWLANPSMICDEQEILYRKLPRSTDSLGLDGTMVLMVPEAIQNDLIVKVHEHHAHIGITKTHSLMKDTYDFHSGMYNRVKNVVTACHQCQKLHQNRFHHRSVPRPIAPQWPPLSSIQYDLLGLLPDHEFKYVMACVCRLTRYTVLIALRKRDAISVAEALYTRIVLKYTHINSMQSDNAKEFVSQMINRLWALMGIRPIHSSTYRPQSQGVTENINFKIAEIIRTLQKNEEEGWVHLLPYVEFIINNTYHSTLAVSAQSAAFGWSIKSQFLAYKQSISDLDHIPLTQRQALGLILERHHKSAKIIRDSIETTHKQIVAKMSQKGREYEYDIGDLVLVYRDLSPAGPGRKTSSLRGFFGPYWVLTRKTPYQYTLQLVADPAKRMTKVSIHRLKPYRPGDTYQAHSLAIPTSQFDDEVDQHLDCHPRELVVPCPKEQTNWLVKTQTTQTQNIGQEIEAQPREGLCPPPDATSTEDQLTKEQTNKQTNKADLPLDIDSKTEFPHVPHQFLKNWKLDKKTHPEIVMLRKITNILIADDVSHNLSPDSEGYIRVQDLAVKLETTKTAINQLLITVDPNYFKFSRKNSQNTLRAVAGHQYPLLIFYKEITNFSPKVHIVRLVPISQCHNLLRYGFRRQKQYYLQFSIGDPQSPRSIRPVDKDLPNKAIFVIDAEIVARMGAKWYLHTETQNVITQGYKPTPNAAYAIPSKHIRRVIYPKSTLLMRIEGHYEPLAKLTVHSTNKDIILATFFDGSQAQAPYPNLNTLAQSEVVKAGYIVPQKDETQSNHRYNLRSKPQ
jgi:hypothetical protein